MNIRPLLARVSDLLHHAADLLNPPTSQKVECPVCLARDIEAKQADEAFLSDLGARW